MDFNANFGEISWVHLFMPPRDMNTAAYKSKFVNMAPYHACTIIAATNTGTAGTDMSLQFNQAQDVDGTITKLLTVKNVFYARASNFQAYTGGWTRIDELNSYVYQPNDSAENQTIFCATVLASEMMVNEGFNHIGIEIQAVGSTQLGSVIGLFTPARYNPVPGVV